jgi:DNA adenine methylase
MKPIAKPFLKWAGGKTRLVQTLRRILPDGNYRFIEPFVGSGAVFLNTRYLSALLSDRNPDIIHLYAVLKAGREGFIDQCRRLFVEPNNSAEKFYALRDEFNACHEAERRSALFVYLNRHCFNGLCRYNRKGAFNVPFGRYDRVYFPAGEMRAFAERLEMAELRAMDFRRALALAGHGDVVYCDPPYVPLTATANFTGYAAGGFSERDQRELHTLAVEAADRGALVVLSNHDTPFTRHLYRGAARLESLLMPRTISCDGTNRTKAAELIAVFGSVR